MRTLPTRAALLPAAIALLAAAPAFAESAQDIVKTALEKHEQRLANVETVTIVQQIMGMEVTNEFEKRVVDGHSTLVPTGENMSGADPLADRVQMEEMAASSKVKGKEKVDGFDCWVLQVDDMSAFESEPQTGGASDFDAKRGFFWIDRKDHLMRRMVMEGEATNDGEKLPITMQMTMRDYRATDGFLWPYATEMVVTGFAAGMSKEDLEEAKESLEEMKKSIAEMPESQREMMESMMGGQIQKLEEMVESGEIRMTIEVTQLTVNGG